MERGAASATDTRDSMRKAAVRVKTPALAATFKRCAHAGLVDSGARDSAARIRTFSTGSPARAASLKQTSSEGVTLPLIT